ncbi:STAS domain-containing protein [Yoonia sp.]|uniref:STAS domain-containing protein n=1 Tax=Yoonia sp. TaxID=2212373 RepID=UPI0019E56756|nr:STAS domain-containing protein [Yoonia sp.]MBE0413988.1 anti-sigma factor antagonist [Yoonia sp.]
MTLDTRTFDLPPIMKIEDCQNLHGFLQQSGGTPVILECASVTRLGGLAAQLIKIAATIWAAQGVPFKLVAPSPGFRDSLRALGLDDLLTEKEGVA